MADDLDLSDFTAGEKVRMAGLIARMAKRGLADDGTGRVDLSDLQRRFERIENQARRRKEQGK
ncbi:hypothetical protein G3I20_29460 [Streptomyces sp. SID8111]|uniref:DUF6257 family protein n=1 Tax=Streptomyces sp. SID8111 TaxID=2706100 RepID=UPI0013C046C1|nr:DUF6257 family protein [Streptomyces sp. SID8111]NEC30620.1 hypothetical protein [Streptomyces sp. SID8111]